MLDPELLASNQVDLVAYKDAMGLNDPLPVQAPSSAPEPLSLLLVGSGAAVAALCWRKVKKSSPC